MLYDECLEIVKKSGMKLNRIPKCHFTVELILIAVAQNGLALGYVPVKYHTNKLCKIAVTQNGIALRYVYIYMCTYELFLIAVRQNPNMLEYITNHYKCPESICCEAINMKSSLFRCIPIKYRTKKICYAALCDYTMRSAVGKYLNLPTTFFKWQTESLSRDQMYFKNCLKIAKKYQDINISCEY
jgi:hypothetical protein